MGGQSPRNKTATVTMIDRRASLHGGNVPDKAEDAAWLRTQRLGSQPRQQGVAIPTEMVKTRKHALHDAMIQSCNHWTPEQSWLHVAKAVSISSQQKQALQCLPSARGNFISVTHTYFHNITQWQASLKTQKQGFMRNFMLFGCSGGL